MNNKTVVTRELLTAGQLYVRESAEGEAPSRTITGYAILFNVPSAPLWEDEDEECREMISPTAVTQELLDASDIKMTMFHNRQLILARSKNGEGTLKYSIDEKGVSFEFEAPHTADGDKALELVRRGDISGCSFMFSTHYYDDGFVKRSVVVKDGKSIIMYTVNLITGIYDFTLAADPAYPDTSCEAEAREREKAFKAPMEEEKKRISEQVREMRCAASQKLYV